MSRDGFPDGVRSLFELLPLLRALRTLVTTCRPLGADDYVLPSEQNTDPATAGNFKRWDLQRLVNAVNAAAGTLKTSLDQLKTVLDTVPDGALNEDPGRHPGLERRRLRGAAECADPPRELWSCRRVPQARGASIAGVRMRRTQSSWRCLRARQALIEQGFLAHDLGTARRAQADCAEHVQPI